jgi:hypothetical protein
MTHIHISVRTAVYPCSILLYTIYPYKPIQPFYHILEEGFLHSLLENREIRLGTTFHRLQAHFSESASVECATHWYASTKDQRTHTEKVICNMVEPHLSFMLVDNHHIQEVHMNEEGAMDRLRDMLC